MPTFREKGKIMLNLNKKLMTEISEILVSELFKSNHNYEHILERHVAISDDGLERRLKKLDNSVNELKIMSRFLDEKTMINSIYACLLNNIEDIAKWIIEEKENGFFKEFIYDFPYVIGEGMVKGIKDKILIKMRRICIILKEGYNGNMFSVQTAYPEISFDDIDEVWDMIEENR